ncbi:MAG: hypothetical protein R3267_11735, partial [Paenisporosarcina sp.]|nr:hypothetical protein [Paenisporosarcina sp.]
KKPISTKPSNKKAARLTGSTIQGFSITLNQKKTFRCPRTLALVGFFCQRILLLKVEWWFSLTFWRSRLKKHHPRLTNWTSRLKNTSSRLTNGVTTII